MAEIEIGAMSRQALAKPSSDPELMSLALGVLNMRESARLQILFCWALLVWLVGN